MIPVYTGFDPREEVGWHAFTSSVMARATETVAFIPVSGPQRDGSNLFTAARFSVPALQRHQGWAVFADACDMVVCGDIAELWALRDASFAVQVVRHDYRTSHPRKYVGTKMESPNVDYPRKNWASLMLMNCAHPAWKRLDAGKWSTLEMLQFAFLKDGEIGDLPREWNVLVDEHGPHPAARLLHWTAGIPGFKHYRNATMADVWMTEHARANHATD